MVAIGRALRQLAIERPDLVIAFPIHRNPLVREAIEPAVRGLDNVIVDEPLAYGEFCALMQRAAVVLTDSGGVQEEAPSLGKPVLVMRDTTERPEAVTAGTVRLVGTDQQVIVEAVQGLLDDDAAYAQMANAVNPYGDGRATERILAAVGALFGDRPGPDEFRAVAD
jgi:UDP-N-acetylglucosamine 2-epimerase (non-hydrolysing)